MVSIRLKPSGVGTREVGFDYRYRHMTIARADALALREPAGGGGTKAGWRRLAAPHHMSKTRAGIETISNGFKT